MEITASHRTHGGTLSFIRHDSAATGTSMTASVFVPPGEGPFPVLYWLSGLTCTAHNFTEKAGAYAAAAAHGLIIVAPDTSPRGEGVANDEAYDLGQGAGFYIDATEAPWKTHFRMESYVTHDLIEVIEANFPAAPNRRGLSGHSMGGHGALTLGMKYPHLFKSVSAFAPIASPTRAPWGEKAFAAYLGADRSLWEAHDAALLLAAGAAKPFDTIRVDIGLADSFLHSQLMPELLERAAEVAGQALDLRYHDGYDHSYYFMQSFMPEHIAFHARRI